MKAIKIIAALLLASAATQAHAATVFVNASLNLGTGVVTLPQTMLITPVVLGVGDTLDFTLTFGPNVRLQAAGETALWPLIFTPSNDDEIQTTSTFEFIGASSNVITGSISISQTMKYVHIGNFISSYYYRTDLNPISFSGIRQVITIDSATVGTPRSYDNVALYAFDGTLTAVSSVPEPAAWATLIGGVALAGGALRRRRYNLKVSLA